MPLISTKARKQKGRIFQQFLRDSLLENLYVPAGLTAEDCRSTTISCPGLDILLSSAARKVCDIDLEAKAQQSLNAITNFWIHYKKHQDSTAVKVLASKRRREEPLATLRWADFIAILRSSVYGK